jgi:alkylation response protein AidB-like acyl-CoA dehydrogenase
MDLNFSAEDEAFRLEVRETLERIVPHEVRNSPSSRNVIERKYREQVYRGLIEKGWMAPTWPKEYGGPGLSPSRQAILLEEMGKIGSPNFDFGVVMIAPLIMEYGTPEQKERFLPKILRAEEFWCQGYSEPNAGSDLASLATRAEIDGDDFVLNGRKIWTSTAYEADWMFILVRTDFGARTKQAGISFLLLDMKSPGISISRIQQITDESHFCEVSLENVRVPRNNLLGKLNEGWVLATKLLSYERTGFVSGDLVRQMLENLIRYAKGFKVDGGTAIEEPGLRRELARASMRIDAARYLGYRNLTRTLRGQPPGPEASVIKLLVSETQQRIGDISTEIQGPLGQLWRDPAFPVDSQWPLVAVANRSATIAGGTSEIQRNIIAERVLGLPR